MDLLRSSRRASVIVAAIMLFAGCGGTQSGSSGPTITPQGVSPGRNATKSWMKPGSSSGDLIYATGGCLGTCVFSYPSGTFVGSLSTSASGGICSDSSGNVFIPDDAQVFEYAHGGTTPIATLSLPGDNANGCAIDPTTGNLAVVFMGSKGNVAIFSGAQGKATQYASNISSSYCGYDNAGNLFVDGYTHESFGFSELPAGASNFTTLSISQNVGGPGQVQWDGSHITWEGLNAGDTTVSRLAISGSGAIIVGATRFKGIRRYAIQSWIYGNRIIIPYSKRGFFRKTIGIWSYPKGGNIRISIRDFGSFQKSTMHFRGVTLSVTP
jgi:hypothetical protein